MVTLKEVVGVDSPTPIIIRDINKTTIDLLKNKYGMTLSCKSHNRPRLSSFLHLNIWELNEYEASTLKGIIDITLPDNTRFGRSVEN